jgi:hypothetical protein
MAIERHPARSGMAPSVGEGHIPGRRHIDGCRPTRHSAVCPLVNQQGDGHEAPRVPPPWVHPVVCATVAVNRATGVSHVAMMGTQGASSPLDPSPGGHRCRGHSYAWVSYLGTLRSAGVQSLQRHTRGRSSGKSRHCPQRRSKGTSPAVAWDWRRRQSSIMTPVPGTCWTLRSPSSLLTSSVSKRRPSLQPCVRRRYAWARNSLCGNASSIPCSPQVPFQRRRSSSLSRRLRPFMGNCVRCTFGRISHKAPSSHQTNGVGMTRCEATQRPVMTTVVPLVVTSMRPPGSLALSTYCRSTRSCDGQVGYSLSLECRGYHAYRYHVSA